MDLLGGEDAVRAVQHFEAGLGLADDVADDVVVVEEVDRGV